MKSVILSPTKKPCFNATKPKNYKDKKYYPKKITKAMLHDLVSATSNDDYHCSNNDGSNELSDEESEATLLVNTTTCKNVSPSDVRKLMSVSEKKKPPDKINNDKKVNKPPNKSISNKKILANKTSTSQEADAKDELVINGKVCPSVNKVVTYSLHKHDTSHSQSLIDRRVNGGVAGEDVRVIHKDSDRKIFICGIDNYEITDVPSVTAAGVSQTTAGELIIVLNQHAYHVKGETIHSSGQT